MCQVIHEDVVQYSERFLNELSRYNYVTPTSYLELLGIFSKLIGLKKNELVVARKRTKTGLDKVSVLYFELKFTICWCLTDLHNGLSIQQCSHMDGAGRIITEFICISPGCLYSHNCFTVDVLFCSC